MVFLCKFSQNPPIGSGDRVQTRLIFTVLIVWWPWKLGQGHQNLISSFNYPNDTIHKVWPESIICFKRQSADKLLFWSKFDIQSAGVTLKMRSRSPKSNHFFPMSQWCFPASLVKIHLLVQETVQTRLTFTVFIVWWPWKLSQGHQNQNKSLNHPNITIYEVWPEYAKVQETGSRQAFFGQNLKFSKCWCDREIKVKSTKSNHFFPPSQ